MRKLLSFSLWHGVGHSDLSPESNTFYLLHYEAFFDEVYQVFLVGEAKETQKFGNTNLVFLGTGNSKMDIIKAPFRLYKYAKELKPTDYLTYEQVWLWWVGWMIKLFLKAKIILLPITIPAVMYEVTKKSLSVILPMWLEKIFISMSYRFADTVLTTQGFGNYVEWLSSEPLVKDKLNVVDILPESTPPPFFFETIKENKKLLSKNGNKPSDTFDLVYVGRLHREKLVDQLIKMMGVLKTENTNIHLNLIGDGSEKEYLQNLAEELDVSESITFRGYVSNGKLPKHLMESDVFVSPLTGCSLREAALCGMPIVAYDIDWVSKLLKHEDTALLIPSGDYKKMAEEVLRLYESRELAKSLSSNVEKFAWKIWSPLEMQAELEKAFRIN